jgi:diguanylate cyclase (GGDEF)-like protein/PAS domain S-box-containing protein
VDRSINDNRKTEDQGMTESENLRQRISELEKSENERSLLQNELRKTKAHLQSLTDSPSNFAVYRLVPDPENPFLVKVLHASPSVKEILGISGPHRIESLYEIIHPEDREQFIVANLKAFETKRFNESFRIFHSERQEWRWIQAVSTEVFDDDEKTIYINGIIIDITDQKKAEEVLRRSHEDLERAVQERTVELARSEERFQLVAQAANDAIYDWDLPSGEAWISQAHQTLFGYEAERVDFNWWREKIHPEDLDQTLFSIRKVIKENGRIWNCEYRFRRADGSFAHVFDRGTVLRDKEGKAVRFVGSMQDNTKRKEAEDALKILSIRDELTGLYNRRGFFNLAEQSIKTAKRAGAKMLLIYGDMDNLKRINDTMGHQEGDRALFGLAQILKETFRESDIIARMGGDEFVILASNGVEDPTEKVLTRFEKILKDHQYSFNHSYPLSVSLGVICFDPQKPYQIDELLSRADKMMYANKLKKELTNVKKH